MLWPPHAKSWLTGKDFDAGRDWGQKEKGTTEDEMAGWHHWLNECVWVNSGSWWWTGRPGVLQFLGSQRVGHEWATELNWTELNPLWLGCVYSDVLCVCAQSCPTVYDSIDCSPSGISVHGFSRQELEWVAFTISRWSSQPRDGIHIALKGIFFTTSTTWEAHYGQGLYKKGKFGHRDTYRENHMWRKTKESVWCFYKASTVLYCQ